ncbi:hypothetical protein [Nostoc sp. TCL26-01]|uniref:hypothetical protein n=1 Tax=Nostoc sp. TCL26-01 TaxID=2576904 RepID=UPI0015BA058E|nr:hypothetical protein [Nostoc sp. TCL26-01]QLE57413.1 hypothetical protein FD725_18950 [Nostoc sp. TCL26-01]
MQKLDSRFFSKKAYHALISLRDDEEDRYHISQPYWKKASGLVQGLPTYISTWGLHRLSGDASKFLRRTSEDTKYKGNVYRKFLKNLQEISSGEFNLEDESSLINMDLRQYTALNHLAIKLAREWSFWSTAILGEAEE